METPIILNSAANPQIKRAIALRTGTAARREAGLFVLDGLRLCMDALNSGIVIEQTFITEAALQKHPREAAALLAGTHQGYRVGDAVLRRLSDVDTPQGVVCVCRIPEQTFTLADICPGGRYLMLERLGDPANLGAIARSCEAFGVDALLMAGGREGAGCSVYGPKAQRAAMGALLRLPVLELAEVKEALAVLKSAGVPTFAAALLPTALAPGELDFSRGGAVLIGNEGAGLESDTIAACDYAVMIPMRGRAQSLNAAAAAAILAYELTR